MTPDGDMPADGEILRVVLATCAEVGGSPVDLLNGVAGVHARYYAGIALAHQYPAAPRRSLARKLGVASALTTARAEMTRRRATWFDLVTLNAVRRRCGRTAMTREEAADAPLVFCGRYEEFLARSGGDRPGVSPLAGSGAESEPASNHTPTEEDEIEPVVASSTLCGDGLGELSSEKGFGADAGVVGLASATLQSSDGRAEGRALEGPTGSLCEDSQDTGAQRSAGSVTPGLKCPASEDVGAVISAQAPSTHTGDLGRAVVEPVVEPGPSDAGIARGGAQNAGLDARNGALSKLIKPVTVAPSAGRVIERAPPQDARRPPDDYRIFRASELGRGSTSYRRADPPPEKRGVVVVTGDLMGDPTPEQRERMRATPGVEPSRNNVGRGKF